MYIANALQNVKFNLNEKGGNLISESAIKSEYNLENENSRYFYFTDNFIIFLKEKNEEKALLTEENKAEMDQEEMAAQMNKSMSLMMPILSVSVSLIAPLGLALYWLINNIIMMIERLMLNKLFSKEEEENG